MHIWTSLMDWWWLVWLCIIIVALLIEWMMPQRYSVCMVVPALVCFILALCKIWYVIQISVFIGFTVLLILFARPYIIKGLYLLKLKLKGETLIGRQFTLTEPIKFGKDGRVTIDGYSWKAIPSGEFEAAANSVVVVVEIRLFKVVVKAV